jgi:glycerophosphoryl diester phosphodiesterase
MRDGALKTQLQQCSKRGSFSARDFSIGHRGAPLQFPEHTRESYEAAARMGAGIVECDVTFTKDKALVCRHAQNDLHTTTNILATPLAAKCTSPSRRPASTPTAIVTPAAAECRTSDITLAEFKTLRGKMDASNPRARTVQEYLAGTAKLAHRSLQPALQRHAADPRREHRAVQAARREDDARAQEPSVTMPFDGIHQRTTRRR